jgi:hypothetical protein
MAFLRTIACFSVVAFITACGGDDGGDTSQQTLAGCACWRDGYDPCGDDTDAGADKSADASPDAGPAAVTR